MRIRPARVWGNWAGDYKVLDPGWFDGQEILKPYCLYVKSELREISDQIAAKIGPDPGPIIEIETLEKGVKKA